MYTCVYIYIYIYIYIHAGGRPEVEGLRLRIASPQGRVPRKCTSTPNPPTNIAGFRGLDSSIILILRSGIPRPIGDLPESLSRAMLVGTMLVERLGVRAYDDDRA